jgi:prevent-host-death family protein
MRVNVGQAKTDLSRLLARVEAGEDVEIARDGVPVARLVRVEPSTLGSRFVAAHGSLAGSITIGDDLEFAGSRVAGRQRVSGRPPELRRRSDTDWSSDPIRAP